QQRNGRQKSPKCRPGQCRWGAAGKPKLWAIDMGGMDHAPLGNTDQRAAVTCRRTRFPASGSIRHITLVDLVAVHVISARKIGIAGGAAVGGWRVGGLAPLG